MAEDALHESFSAATKALFGTLGFLLLMFGGEMMLEKHEPRLVLGAILCALGAICFYMVWAGRTIRQRLPNATIIELNRVAADPRWWLATVLVFVGAITVWRVVDWAWTPAEMSAIQANEAQKETLIGWLQQAQGERDQARRERDQAKASGETLHATGTVSPGPLMPPSIAEISGYTMPDKRRLKVIVDGLRGEISREKGIAQTIQDVQKKLSGAIDQNNLQTEAPRLIEALNHLDSSASTFENTAQDLLQGRGEFRAQVDFVMGSREAEGKVQTAARECAATLQRWIKIQNNADKEMTELLRPCAVRLAESVAPFTAWLSGIATRLETIEPLLPSDR